MRFAEMRNISLSEVLRKYSKQELDLWQAYYQREITDNQRIEYLIAQGIALYINANSKKGSQKAQSKDFIFKANWLTDETSDSQTIINEFLKGA